MADPSLPRSAAGNRSPWLIAVIVSIATFMEVLDVTIVNVALRHISGSLATSLDESTWIVTSYLVSNAVVLPISGWLANVIGRKRFTPTLRRYLHRCLGDVCDVHLAQHDADFACHRGHWWWRHGTDRAVDLRRDISGREAGTGIAPPGPTVVTAPAVGSVIGGSSLTDNLFVALGASWN